MDSAEIRSELNKLLADRDEQFWPEMAKRIEDSATFNELIGLAAFRKRAHKLGFTRSRNGGVDNCKVALIGGSSLYPLSELVELVLSSSIGEVQLWTGEYNNYRAEVLEASSPLYQFNPEIVFILPDEQSCKYTGNLNDPEELVENEIRRVTDELLQLCTVAHERSGAEILLCNYILPSSYDPGPLRQKSLATDWSFKRGVNSSLGRKSPNYVHICDLEFLAYRVGGLCAKDERSWFESKQLCSPSLQVALAKEISHLIRNLKQQPKKVLALDLDNTLWGGVIGDDGIEGIEIGGTSPRGEAFKAFQEYILSLTKRGILLAACSKNDLENALEPFKKHPEMVLKEEHFVSFKANWEPKAQNLINMANELSLGLDSFVFVDDNPGEVENVRQFAPEVTSILLGPDPSGYTQQLQDSRLFERTTITDEDLQRSDQYRAEATRRSLLSTVVDMESYLHSLEMVGTFRDFNPIDLPRIAQLINKSNQFNLTTRRRTEAELELLMADPKYSGFSMRLSDRFGDHGLISVVICLQNGADTLEIDTWLMSCRVLKRQVEEATLNQIVRIARDLNCSRIKGRYRPSPKNSMVSDLYPRLGFSHMSTCPECSEFELDINNFAPFETHITVN